MIGHQFISYSRADAADFALRLHDALEGARPHVPAWLDKRDIPAGQQWSTELREAIRDCGGLLFVMTRDSVSDNSGCMNEWSSALGYKKPVIPLRLDPEVELPYRLEGRQIIEFSSFDQGIAELRNHWRWLDTPKGVLRELENRRMEADRALAREKRPDRQRRILAEIEELDAAIKAQRRIVADPEGRIKEADESIATGIDLVRKGGHARKPTSRTRFLNSPPAVTPKYFQNRTNETRMIGEVLRDESKRMLIVLGRGGLGKTVTVCRVLESLQLGKLPDDGGPLKVDGIIYLSAFGTRPVSASNFYEDLLALLPVKTAKMVEPVVRDRKIPAEEKMRKLLEGFPTGRTVVLLDAFEAVIDRKTLSIVDTELAEALEALLKLAHHGVKVILTTQVPPRNLAEVEPGRQFRLEFDAGLKSPHAENILREMDADGKLGLRSAPDQLLAMAGKRTRGYPKALEHLFGILSNSRDMTLAEFLDQTAAMLPEKLNQVLIGEAFGLFDPASQRVIQALAVIGSPVPTNAIDYILQPHQPGLDSGPVLSRLVNTHFARKEAGRYYLHPIDQAYAISKLIPGDPSEPDPGQEYTLRGLQFRAAEWLRQTRSSSESWKTPEDLLPQLAEFDLRCKFQDYETAGRILREISLNYLIAWGLNNTVVALNEQLLGWLARTHLKASLLTNLGIAHGRLGQTERAIECHKQAVEIAIEVGDRTGEGVALGHLGSRSCYHGQSRPAIKIHEQALSIAREVGKRDSEAAWLGNLGTSHAAIGRMEQAIAYHEQAFQLSHLIGDRDGEAIALGNLGECQSALGQTTRALRSLQQALDLRRKANDRSGEGHVLFQLATVHLDVGEHDEALRRARDAVRIGEDILDPMIVSSGNLILALARLHADDLDRAYEAAEAACRAFVPRNQHIDQALLALIHQQKGERYEAMDASDKAISHAEMMLGRCDRNYKAMDAKGIALACLTLLEGPTHEAEAIESFQKARAITTAPGIVGRVTRLLDLLDATDSDGLLAGIREAATGEATAYT